MIYYILCAALLILNLLAFAMMGIDKRRAIKNKYRIPEKTLLFYAAPFAALGAYMGMIAFRHKIRNPKFFIGVPVMMVTQVALAVWLFVKGIL